MIYGQPVTSSGQGVCSCVLRKRELCVWFGDVVIMLCMTCVQPAANVMYSAASHACIGSDCRGTPQQQPKPQTSTDVWFCG